MSDAIREAQSLYRECLDALTDQRAQIEEDLAFSDPSDPQQWDASIRQQRENDPGGKRPCMVFDQLGQYISNVSGQIDKSPPSLHALPVDSGADKRTAEQLDGFFRHIEYASRAQQHYARALLSAARCGVGYLTVRPEYVQRALNWQEPRIGSEGDPLRVVFDPWSQEMDGADATLGYLLSSLSRREFRRKYPDKDPVSFDSLDRKLVDDDRESVIIAEAWRMDSQKRRMIVAMGQNGEEVLSIDDFLAQQETRPLAYLREFEDRVTVVKWALMSGAEYLSKETVYPADGIGIVPVYGYVGFTKSRMTYCGMARRARAPQQSYNYHMSEMHVHMGQAPKAPWTIPMRAFGGSEQIKELWDRAAAESRAYLPYHDLDEQGPINRPERTPLSVNLQNHMAGAEQALRDIQAALGMYQANLGAPSNETSGIAIENRKEQGEASTSLFPANLAASIGQVGKLCMQMIPRLIDTQRQVRILGLDDTPSTVRIDPKQEEPYAETDDGIAINPGMGQYDVRVVVGASYSTQRQQAQAAFTEMMRAAPQLMPAIAPLWAQTLDIPDSAKLAQVLTAVAPAEVKEVLQPKQQGPTTADLIAKVQELSAAVQEAAALAQESEQELAEMQAKLDAKDKENEIAEYNAETQRLKVVGGNEDQMRAVAMQLLQEMGIIVTPGMMEAPPEQAEQQEPMQ